MVTPLADRLLSPSRNTMMDTKPALGLRKTAVRPRFSAGGSRPGSAASSRPGSASARSDAAFEENEENSMVRLSPEPSIGSMKIEITRKKPAEKDISSEGAHAPQRRTSISKNRTKLQLRVESNPRLDSPRSDAGSQASSRASSRLSYSSKTGSGPGSVFNLTGVPLEGRLPSRPGSASSSAQSSRAPSEAGSVVSERKALEEIDHTLDQALEDAPTLASDRTSVTPRQDEETTRRVQEMQRLLEEKLKALENTADEDLGDMLEKPIEDFDPDDMRAAHDILEDIDGRLKKFQEHQSEKREELSDYVKHMRIKEDDEGEPLLEFPEHFDNVQRMMETDRLRSTTPWEQFMIDAANIDTKYLEIQESESKVEKGLEQIKRNDERLQRIHDDHAEKMGKRGSHTPLDINGESSSVRSRSRKDLNRVLGTPDSDASMLAGFLKRNAEMGANARFFTMSEEDNAKAEQILEEPTKVEPQDGEGFGHYEEDSERLHEIDMKLQNFVPAELWEEMSIMSEPRTARSEKTKREVNPGRARKEAETKDFITEEREDKELKGKIVDIDRALENMDLLSARRGRITEEEIQTLLAGIQGDQYKPPKQGVAEEAATPRYYGEDESSKNGTSENGDLTSRSDRSIGSAATAHSTSTSVSLGPKVVPAKKNKASNKFVAATNARRTSRDNPIPTKRTKNDNCSEDNTSQVCLGIEGSQVGPSKKVHPWPRKVPAPRDRPAAEGSASSVGSNPIFTWTPPPAPAPGSQAKQVENDCE